MLAAKVSDMDINQFKSAEELNNHLLSGCQVFGIRKNPVDIEDVVALVPIRAIDRIAYVSLTDEAEAGRQLAKEVRAKCRQLSTEFFENNRKATA